jgi:hypothetical protein
MTDSTPSNIGSQKPAAWLYGFWPLFVAVIFLLSLPGFLTPHNHLQEWSPSRSGVVFGVVFVLVSIWLFLRCPYRYWLAKILALASFVAVAYFAIRISYDYISYWSGRGELWSLPR